MRRITPLLSMAATAAALALAPAAAFAADYRSGFGFGFQLSDDWVVLTRPQVQKAFQNDTQASLGLSTLDRANFDDILGKVKTGQVEFVFDRRFSTKDWNNNISLQRAPAKTVAPEQAARDACPTLAAGLRTTFGTEVKVTTCGTRTIADVAFVAYEYQVPAQNVTIVQYEIPFGSQGTLALVGGSNDAGLAHLRAAQLAIAAGAIRSLGRPPVASQPLR